MVGMSFNGYPGLLDDDPYYRVPGHENLRAPKPVPEDDRIWQEKVRDFGNEWANYLFGPHLPSVGGLLEFSDAADVVDAAENNQNFSQALSEGRYMDAAKWAPFAGVSSLAAMIPAFSAGPFDNVANAFNVAGAVTGGSSVVPKPANALNMGIRAFHGSPHSFPPVRLIEMQDGTRLYQNMDELADTPQGARIIQEYPMGRFDMSKIGTGEGAQAYGHGLYFAEREGVAKSYRDALSPKNYLLNAPEPEIAQKYGQDVLDMFISHGGDPNELKDTISRLSDQNKRDLYDLGLSDVSQVKPQNDWGIEASLVTRADRLNRLQGLLASEDVKVDPGSMYEVRINADPNAFLDWDKPLSEQPEAVRTALKKLDIDTGSMTAKDRVETIEAALKGDPRLSHLLGKGGVNITGDTLYKGISDSLGAVDWPVTADAATRAQYRSKGATNATQALKEAGIPGIKYLDAGSRYTPANLPNNPIANEARQFLDAAQGDGEKALQLFRDSNPVDRWAGSERDEITKVIKSAAKPVTRNYVVFDDNLIEILRKYGIAGLLGGGAAMSAMGQPQEQY